jgi:hypothetical protein
LRHGRHAAQEVRTQQVLIEAHRFTRGENLILPPVDESLTVDKIIAASDLLRPPSMDGSSSDAMFSHVTLN